MSDEPSPLRRLRPVTWAAIGCTVLAVLAIAALAGLGWLVARLFGGS